MGEALESIASEDDGDIECLVSDDGSADDTLAIVESFAARIPIRLIPGAHAGNWVASTNRALSLARGDLVSILHQDDYWLPGRLAAVKQLVREFPDCVLYMHATRYVGPTGRTLGSLTAPLPPGRPVDAATMTEALIVQNFIAVASAVFRRHVALDGGGLDERLWYTADWDLWLRICSRGYTVYSRRPLAAFRLHPTSLTMAGSRDDDEFRRQMESLAARHFAVHGDLSESVRDANRLSIEVNCMLAQAVHRRRLPLLSLLRALVSYSPRTTLRFARCSRIVERCLARLRAGLLAR